MSDPDLTEPTYTHWVTQQIRFSDTDAMGHVNNVALAAHIESGRVALGIELAGRVDDGLTVILRRLEIDYLREVHFPGELRVGARVLSIGTTSFTIGVGVFRDEDCVATSRAVLVVLGPDGPAEITGRRREVLEAELPS